MQYLASPFTVWPHYRIAENLTSLYGPQIWYFLLRCLWNHRPPSGLVEELDSSLRRIAVPFTSALNSNYTFTLKDNDVLAVLIEFGEFMADHIEITSATCVQYRFWWIIMIHNYFWPTCHVLTPAGDLAWAEFLGKLLLALPCKV